jgi:hypothetical protein
MAHYRLADILTQEIPDIVLVDIALHWQSNDNWPTGMESSRASRHNDRFHATAQRAGFGVLNSAARSSTYCLGLIQH